MAAVTVIGAGVLGTMHAWFALARGHQVMQLERDTRPRSASVRSFGLVWVSRRRDGPELELASRARSLWEQVAAEVRALGFRAHVSMTVALDAAEADVMQRYAHCSAAQDRGTDFLDPEQVRALNPALRGRIAGALHDGLERAHLSAAAIQRCQLQMMETDPYPETLTCNR